MKKIAITLIPILLVIFCIVSLLATFGPIMLVESEYQYHKALNNTFHVNNLQALVVPKFNIDFSTSKNKNYGMTIPKLYMDEPIIFNVDPQNRPAYMAALKHGIAQAAGTNLPGYPGLGYYFAHSSSAESVSQYNAVFYLLGKLEKGDEVDIWRDGERYQYTVYDTKITTPEDVSFLQPPTDDSEIIVLQTCWPPGTTLKRLLVFAKRS